MGSEERQPQPDLSTLVEPIAPEAPRYAFYRLVYLLQRMATGSPAIGQLGPASDERIRLRGSTQLTFASSDVAGLRMVKTQDGVARAQITTTFMSLYGSVSPLPAYFAEKLALDEYQGGPQPIREFLDVFHHRLLSLVYRSWSKYRLSVNYRVKGRDPFTRRMLCAVGVDAFHEHETALDRFLWLRYAPILASKSRSARGLEVVLGDLFGKMGVRVEQFVGQWTLLEKPLRNKIGVANSELGESLTIGRYVYDGTGRFTIVLGPLEYDEYLSFLPGGHRRPLLRSIVATFTRGIYDVMLELHVKTAAAPRFQLGAPRASTLRRTAWVGGSGKERFVITVPLLDPRTTTDDDDDDYSEPPEA